MEGEETAGVGRLMLPRGYTNPARRLAREARLQGWVWLPASILVTQTHPRRLRGGSAGVGAAAAAAAAAATRSTFVYGIQPYKAVHDVVPTVSKASFCFD